jgi:hypothetical protein
LTNPDTPVPEAVRAMAEKTVAQTREVYQAGFGQLCAPQKLSRRPWRTKIF